MTEFGDHVPYNEIHLIEVEPHLETSRKVRDTIANGRDITAVATSVITAVIELETYTSNLHTRIDAIEARIERL